MSPAFDLTPFQDPLLLVGGDYGTVEKVDDYTIRFNFKAPYPMFPQLLAGQSTFGGG